MVEVARVVAWTDVVGVAASVLETTTATAVLVVSATGVLVLTTTDVVVAATGVVLATYAVSDKKWYTIYKEKNLPLHR